jgi:hypothetical protein
MMQRDLKSARSKWIEESGTDAERHSREKADFLKYCDSDGLFADFHSNRHMFITSLEHASVSPKMAQTLARHSDVRLTLGIYTRIGLHDQSAAIESLPAPPGSNEGPGIQADVVKATGTHDATANGGSVVPTMVPKMVPFCLHRNSYGLHQLALMSERPKSMMWLRQIRRSP